VLQLQKNEEILYPHYNPDLKPYDPQKAGAAIVASFDITDNFFSLETRTFYGQTIIEKIDFAEHNDCIYIRFRNWLCVFDKKTMQLLDEIRIIMPEKYSFVLSAHTVFMNNGLVIADDYAFVLLVDVTYPPYPRYLFSINLDTGNAELINERELGFTLNSGSPYYMGYDQKNNVIWFRVEDRNKNYHKDWITVYSVRYDKSTNTFMAIGKKEWGRKVNEFIDDKTNPSLIASSVYDNVCWNVYFSDAPRLYVKSITLMDKRNMDDLTKSLHVIDVEYLGTQSVPPGLIYDPPYIWIMVERDGRIQMLKLLPNE
jgi:hypothetical protein